MRKRFLLLGILIYSLILGSCSKSPICWGEDKNEGMIVKYYFIHDFPMCIEGYIQENGNMIIRDTIELNNIIGATCHNLPEAGYSTTIPYINFETYSLLGFWTIGRCTTKFKREFIKDENNHKYIYRIEIKDCGTCYSGRYDANLILVPKLEDNYCVEFIKEDKD